jgi:hypothetical protein
MSIVLTGFILLLVSRSGGADDQTPTDPIERADVLLADVELPTWEADPLWQGVYYGLHHRLPVLQDTRTILQVKAIVCGKPLPPLERVERLFTVAQWQRAAGLHDEATELLYEAFEDATKGYASSDAPSMGYNVNWFAQVAHCLIQWNRDSDDILRAVKLGEAVRMHEPRHDFRYTATAAESARHDLVARLSEREKTSLNRARAWANAAIGYDESGDCERAIAAASRCVADMERIPPEEMRPELEDWRLKAVFILADAGETDVAKQALRVVERGKHISVDDLTLATAWLRIGEDEEALARIERYYGQIPERASGPEDEAWTRATVWIVVALAYVERGDLADAETALAKIPAKSQNRMRGVRFVGKQLLKQGDADSKRAAREFFARHAPLAAHAEKVPDENPFGWLEETVYCAHDAACAGAIDAVEKDFLPTMTPKERQEVMQSLAACSTELPLDNRVKRFVAPEPDPTARVELLRLISERLGRNDERDQIERLILHEDECPRWKMVETVIDLAERRQSIRHWDRARELFERALALAGDIEHKGRRASELKYLSVEAWLHGHKDLARVAAEQLIDLAWDARKEPIKDWDAQSRGRSVLAAKQLLASLDPPKGMLEDAQ